MWRNRGVRWKDVLSSFLVWLWSIGAFSLLGDWLLQSNYPFIGLTFLVVAAGLWTLVCIEYVKLRSSVARKTNVVRDGFLLVGVIVWYAFHLASVVHRCFPSQLTLVHIIPIEFEMRGHFVWRLSVNVTGACLFLTLVAFCNPLWDSRMTKH